MLYSYQGARPAPLPFRIHINGSTRTDPSTFTAEEITAAGFTGPYTEPPYNAAIEQLDWVDGEYVTTPIPPPQPAPQWVQFAGALGADLTVNQFVASLAQTAPVLHLMIGVGMGQAAGGDFSTFLAAWTMGASLGLVTPELTAHVTGIAQTFNLPPEFIAGL